MIENLEIKEAAHILRVQDATCRRHESDIMHDEAHVDESLHRKAFLL
jgi:hypothetical protein